MKVQRSIEIAAPPQKIWPFLVQPDKIPKWYGTMQQFAYTSEQRSGVGTSFYFEEKAAGRLMRLRFIVTDWVEPDTLAFKMTAGDFLKAYAQRWTVTAIPTGSRFTYVEEIRLPYGIIGNIMGLFAWFNSQATLKRMLVNLKSLAEA